MSLPTVNKKGGTSFYSKKKIYTEIVIVTVFSLVAAGLWQQVLYEYLQRYHQNSLTSMIVTAILATIISIIILNMMFAD